MRERKRGRMRDGERKRKKQRQKTKRDTGREGRSQAGENSMQKKSKMLGGRYRQSPQAPAGEGSRSTPAATPGLLSVSRAGSPGHTRVCTQALPWSHRVGASVSAPGWG